MISTLRLRNFRSYRDASFEFEGGVNIVVGPNASGKTNLLEAVLVLARGSSYRARDIDLIKKNKKWAQLDGFFGSNSRVVRFENNDGGDKSAKLFSLDGKKLQRLSLERTVPVVFFEPNHLQLISQGPNSRRDYFDDLLERTKLGYKPLLASYRRTLAQRNSLLKQPAHRAKSQLFAWDVRLSELGEKVVGSRVELIEEMNQTVAKNYSRIATKKNQLSLGYQAQFNSQNYSSRMLSKLEANTDLDFQRGFTGCGPHREDFSFELNGQPISSTASRGEIRSIVLALKVIELALVEKTRGQKPIFLLDDVFSELDGARRRALVKYLKKYQAIITTTDADAVIGYFGDHNLVPLS
ncbi:hypothetical protein A3F38_02305 [Candidatus Saccharibacteria bacterium RIFCSPHIGHO2_12_FULL_48_21]|nr:MAG: hypothetical protein A3F38_02305 [Candidatus Saccharibacteria bacterium RIFCSPHIGHO2_12_FULL_48_21]